MQLKDRVALVTGASQGRGRAISLAFAKEGAKIAISDIDEKGAALLANEIKDCGGESLICTCPVQDFAAVGGAVEKVLDRFKRIDILINNAGITRDKLLIKMEESDWKDVLDVNLNGAFNWTRQTVRAMMKQRAGKIVNIASVIGIVGNVGQANYSASKAGVIGLTKSAARELAPWKINVNAVAPVYISTGMTAKLPEKVKEKLLNAVPLGVIGKPEDVADAVLFLASDRARYITGQVINIDGGLVM